MHDHDWSAVAQWSKAGLVIERARFESPLLPFRRFSFSSLTPLLTQLYLAIDSGGNVSDLVLARNCCLARMLPGEAENGVGMNRSLREGKKCKAL